MKASWRRFFRRVAQVCCVFCASGWSSAVVYAQIASDNATNPVYADGWQAGDNGGVGFTPWNFDNDTLFYVEGVRDINTTSQFNQLGTAWRLGLNYLQEGKDIVRVGRGLATPLQIGQTLSIVADPPAETAFFNIETIRFNTGGGNICYGGDGCTPGTSPQPRFAWSFFNWTEMDDWGRWTASSLGGTSLFNVDKSPFEHPDFPSGAAGTDAGVRLDFTLTGAETYSLTATPLDNPSAAFSGSGTLDNPGTGTIDWIEFMHYGEESHELFSTDFYIKSLEVTGPAADTADFDDDGDVDGADLLTWQEGLGTPGAVLAHGNADSDNDVDADDLNVWKQQFGAGAASAALTAGETCGCGKSRDAILAAVPEPASLGLAVAALGSLAGGRLIRRKRTSNL